MERVLSGSGITRVSKKGMEPSGLVSSVVNWMQGSMEFMCSRNFLMCNVYWMTKKCYPHIFK